MGPKSLDSTVGTKPATKAQLDSTTFKMGWFSRSCDLTNLSMGFVFLCEGSSFSQDYFLLHFLLGGEDMMDARKA
jgi:hypothetical protein